LFITVRQSYEGVHASKAPHATDAHTHLVADFRLGRMRDVARCQRDGNTEKTRFIRNRCVEKHHYRAAMPDLSARQESIPKLALK
jgi:hypothetical protein